MGIGSILVAHSDFAALFVTFYPLALGSANFSVLLQILPQSKTSREGKIEIAQTCIVASVTFFTEYIANQNTSKK